jgi:hypothetical protein
MTLQVFEKIKEHCLKCLMKLSKKWDKKILSNLLVIMSMHSKLLGRLYNKDMALFFGLFVLPIALI